MEVLLQDINLYRWFSLHRNTFVRVPEVAADVMQELFASLLAVTPLFATTQHTAKVTPVLRVKVRA